MEVVHYPLQPPRERSSHAVYAYAFWLVVLCAAVASWQGIPILLVLLFGCLFYLAMVVAINSLNIYYQPASKPPPEQSAILPEPQEYTPVLPPPARTLIRQPDGSYIVRR